MHTVDVLLPGFGILDHADRSPNDDVQRAAVRHQADVVVEHAARVEQRDREAEEFLDEELELVDARVRVGRELVVEVVLPEGEDGDQIRAGADRHLDEAFAALEDEAEGTGLCVEGFARAADYDGDGAAHSFLLGVSGVV